MIVRPKRRLVAPLLAMSMAFVLSASASAQDRYYERSQSPSLNLQISFGSNPHWQTVSGTRVRTIQRRDRSDYDVFQYGRSYYADNNRNERWYRSNRWRGQFRLIDDRSVPRELRRVPRDHWRNYPASWEDRNDRDSRNSGATLRITFGSTPRWSNVSGTRVETISMADRDYRDRDYDVFRYGDAYYAYSGDRWYTSRRESGDFTLIDDRNVPSEISRVPKDQWHSYPATWQGRPDGMPPGQAKKRHRGNHGN